MPSERYLIHWLSSFPSLSNQTLQGLIIWCVKTLTWIYYRKILFQQCWAIVWLITEDIPSKHAACANMIYPSPLVWAKRGGRYTVCLWLIVYSVWSTFVITNVELLHRKNALSWGKKHIIHFNGFTLCTDAAIKLRVLRAVLFGELQQSRRWTVAICFLWRRHSIFINDQVHEAQKCNLWTRK